MRHRGGRDRGRSWQAFKDACAIALGLAVVVAFLWVMVPLVAEHLSR